MATKSTTTVPTVPRKREDPVARAERLLAEAKAKAKALAEKQIIAAREGLAVAVANRDKWQGFVDERRSFVEDLERALGISTPVAEDDQE